MRIYAFADEASPAIDSQIAAMRRNGLNGLEIRGVDGENVSAISLKKAKEVRRYGVKPLANHEQPRGTAALRG